MFQQPVSHPAVTQQPLPQQPAAQQAPPQQPPQAQPYTPQPAAAQWDQGVAPEQQAEPGQPVQPAQPVQPVQPVPLDGPPSRRRSRSNIRLADLLTEALMAYQDVRDAADPGSANRFNIDPSAGLPGPTSVPTPPTSSPTTIPTPPMSLSERLAGSVGSVGLDPAVGSEPGYAANPRHRSETPSHVGDQRRNVRFRET
jgi:hypothetical protein